MTLLKSRCILLVYQSVHLLFVYFDPRYIFTKFWYSPSHCKKRSISQINILQKCIPKDSDRNKGENISDYLKFTILNFNMRPFKKHSIFNIFLDKKFTQRTCFSSKKSFFIVSYNCTLKFKKIFVR